LLVKLAIQQPETTPRWRG